MLVIFTVILYWETRLNLEDYDFLFSDAQLQNQLVKMAYFGNCVQTIAELNRYTEKIYDWKLILFDARIVSKNKKQIGNVDFEGPDIIRKEWNELLQRLFGENKKELKSVPPREVWYLSCWEKGLYTADNDKNEFAYAKLLLNREESKKIFNINISEEYTNINVFDVLKIPFFRMCWIQLSPETGIHYQQEELKVCCILLILTYNDISTSFINSGYLYDINIEIDRRQFSQYIANLRWRNFQLKEQIQKEMEKYYEIEQDLVQYISPEGFSAVSAIKFGPFKDVKRYKLKYKDLSTKQKETLDNKLRNNWQWLHEQIYSVQDYLHKQIIRPAELETKNRNKLLNSAGQEDVKIELENAIKIIQLKRQTKESPMQIKRQLREKEDKIYNQINKRKYVLEIKPILVIFAIIEGLTFHVFLSKGKVLSIIIIAIATGVFLWIISCIINYYVYHQYNNYLKRVSNKQQLRMKNINELMMGIAKYQYHWTLLNRQFEICEKQERKKKYLYHHSMVQKNVTNVYSFLERMIGEDEHMVAKSIFLPGIDFSKEPEQVEYYWIFPQGYDTTRGLNHTEYKIDVLFGFISEFEIHITPALKV